MDVITEHRPVAELTLVVHGTFATQENWWRLGGNGEKTFADRLEAILAEQGVSGTVWTPALEQGFRYEDFAWSGTNKHKDRIAGAAKLRSALGKLADRLDASEKNPLVVNVVAHSHGGNVVLEALRGLPDSIQVGRVVLLGTPLISFSPAVRVLRAVFAGLILGIIMLTALFFVLLPFFMTHDFFSGIIDVSLFAGALLIIPFYGWLFYGLASACDVVWRLLYSPIKCLHHRWGGQVYGPSLRSLKRILRGHKALLFTSALDEAEIVLQLSVAPRHVYLDYLRERWNKPARFAEFIGIRPIVVGMFLRASEIFLERYVLGFSWIGTLFFDYEMVDLHRGRQYPPAVLAHVDVTTSLQPTFGDKMNVRTSAAELAKSVFTGGHDDAQRTATLRESLRAIGADIATQIKLRHSLYYENEEIVTRTAGALVRGVARAHSDGCDNANRPRTPWQSFDYADGLSPPLN